jgi:hypothetical protein
MFFFFILFSATVLSDGTRRAEMEIRGHGFARMLCPSDPSIGRRLRVAVLVMHLPDGINIVPASTLHGAGKVPLRYPGHACKIEEFSIVGLVLPLATAVIDTVKPCRDVSGQCSMFQHRV